MTARRAVLLLLVSRFRGNDDKSYLSFWILKRTTVLREIAVTSENNEPVKRWFTDHDTDLFVWLDNDNHIIKFQVCYNRGKNEHALTWEDKQGFSHHAVDDGEEKVMKMKKSPILVQDGQVDLPGVSGMFRNIGQELPAFIYNFILEKLDQ